MGRRMLTAVADTAITRTLALALRTIGSLERLAAYLGAPQSALRDWMEGRSEAPIDIYLRALDLVARGPLAEPPEGGSRKP
jgi:DNA-binding transcriptional regulator YiaG